jgi:hypothetical protein
VGPRADVDAVENRKINLEGNGIEAIKPLARRYTDSSNNNNRRETLIDYW